MKNNKIFSIFFTVVGVLLILISMIFLGLVCSEYKDIINSKIHEHTIFLLFSWLAGFGALVVVYFMKHNWTKWAYLCVAMLSVSIAFFGVNQNSVTQFLTTVILHSPSNGNQFMGIHLLYAIPTLFLSISLYVFSLRRERQNFLRNKDTEIYAQNIANNNTVGHAWHNMFIIIGTLVSLLYLCVIEFLTPAYFALLPNHSDTPAEFFNFVNWTLVCIPLILASGLLIISYLLKIKRIEWIYFLIGTILVKAILLRVFRGIITNAESFSRAMFYPSQIIFLLPMLILCICLFVWSVNRMGTLRYNDRKTSAAKTQFFEITR